MFSQLIILLAVSVAKVKDYTTIIVRINYPFNSGNMRVMDRNMLELWISFKNKFILANSDLRKSNNKQSLMWKILNK